MKKNIKGGKNYKKHKKIYCQERSLIYKEDEQEYARIIKKFGDGRFECQIFNNDTNVVGKIRGSLRKKVWINIGDIVLLSTRSFDSSNYDIIHKYNLEESKDLKLYGELPSNINLQASNIDLETGKLKQDDDDYVDFCIEDI